MVVFAEPARVEIDDLFQAWCLAAHLQEFVHLLLVFDHGKSRAAVLQHIRHLLGHAVLIERNRNSTAGLARDHGPIKMRAVVADDRDVVAFPKTELDHAQGKLVDLVADLCPRPALPDAELLLAACGGVAEFTRITIQ